MKDENGNEIVEEPSVEKVLETEIDDLFEDEVIPKEEPPKEEEPPADPPAEETPSGKEPATPPAEELPKEELPKEEPSKEEPPAEELPANEEIPPAEDDEFTRLKTQNEKLLKLIEDGASPKASAEKPPSEETPAKPIPPAPPAQVEGMEEYLNGIDFDKVMETKEEFVKFMLKVTSGVQERTRQTVLTSIPQIVGNYVQQKATMDTVANAFYKDNPELKRSKKFVSIIANEVHAENPTMKIEDVMKETAKRAKESLGLNETVQKKDKEKVTKPKPQLPGTSSTKQPPAPPKGLADEIDDLFD